MLASQGMNMNVHFSFYLSHFGFLMLNNDFELPGAAGVPLPSDRHQLLLRRAPGGERQVRPPGLQVPGLGPNFTVAD